MLVLASTDIIRLGLSAATAVDVLASYADNSAAFAPASQATTVAVAGPTTIVSAPGAGVTRNVSHVSLRARGGANALDVEFFNGAAFDLVTAALASGERLEYENGRGWSVYDAAGAFKQSIAAGAGSIALTSLATPAANTIVANATAGVASPTAVPMANAESVFGRTAGNLQAIDSAVQTALIRAAGSVFWASAAAGQVLGRTAAGGNLGFGPPPGGLLRAPQVVTATNAAFAHPTGTALIVAIVVAGGGGGTGVANSSLSQITVGGGGASGGHLFHVFTAISGTSNVTIGAAGTAGANTGAAAGNGGNTSVVHNGVTVTAQGGPGAPLNTTTGMAGVSALTFGATPGALPPAVSTSALLNGGGHPGGIGLRFSGTAAQSGSGAGGIFGGGGVGRLTQGNGNNATGPGGGGAGGLSINNAGAVTGGSGGAGFVIFFEFG